MSPTENDPVTAGISRKTYDGLNTDQKLDVLLDFSISHENDLREVRRALAAKKKTDIKISASTAGGVSALVILLRWLISAGR